MRQLEEIRSKFNSFVENVKSNPTSREDILKEAHKEIEDALKGEITPELVHLAVDDIYPYMGKLGIEKRIPLLRKYMNEAPDDTERFWAHERLINSLAFLRRNREAIEEHFQLYHWACEHLPAKYVLEAISILSMADCLKAEGRIDELDSTL